MTIAELRAKQEQVLAQARTALDDISADGVTEERASELETQHDKAMAEYDRLGTRADRAEALEKREAETEARAAQPEAV